MSTCVCEQKLGSVRRIFLQNVVVVKGEHVLLGQIEDSRTDEDGLVEEKCSFGHVDEGQILVNDLEFFKVWFRDESFGLLRIRRKFNVRSQSDVLDRFPVYLKNNSFSVKYPPKLQNFTKKKNYLKYNAVKNLNEYDAVKNLNKCTHRIWKQFVQVLLKGTTTIFSAFRVHGNVGLDPSRLREREDSMDFAENHAVIDVELKVDEMKDVFRLVHEVRAEFFLGDEFRVKLFSHLDRDFREHILRDDDVFRS